MNCQHEIIRNGTNGVEIDGFKRCDREASYKVFETHLCSHHARTWHRFSRVGTPTRLMEKE